jgi:hypothetical protein
LIREHRDKARPLTAPVHPLSEVEAQESRRVKLAEPAKEGVVGGDPEPAPAHGGGTNKAGRAADAEDDLFQEVRLVQ